VALCWCSNISTAITTATTAIAATSTITINVIVIIVVIVIGSSNNDNNNYPTTFACPAADMAAAGFNRGQALANLKRVSHHARVFELSAKTGDGMKAWLDFLVQQRETARAGK
jgi:Ni2+-binding GTPase involved in maturation of urease and hydrogenase